MALPTPWNQALQSKFLMRLIPNSKLWGNGAAFSTDRPTAVEAVSGACMMMRTDVFRTLGGFKSEVSTYLEDMDLCMRVRRLRLTIYHIPSATVVHHGGGSSRIQYSQFSTLNLRTATEIYMQLNHGTQAAMSYRILQGASAVVRLTATLPSYLLSREQRRLAAKATLTKWWHVLKWSFGSFPPNSLNPRRSASH